MIWVRCACVRLFRNPCVLKGLQENWLTFTGMAIKDGLVKKNEEPEPRGDIFLIETGTHSTDFSFAASLL